MKIFKQNLFCTFEKNSSEMHSNKKHYHGLTLSENVKVTRKESKANAQGANYLSEKWVNKDPQRSRMISCIIISA